MAAAKSAVEVRPEAGPDHAKIVETVPIGMHMYRLDDEDRLIFCGSNPAADRILGVESGDLLGKPLDEAFPRLAGTEAAERYFKAAKDGEVWRTDKIIHREGKIKGAFDVLVFPSEPRSMVAAFVDVTRRRQSEDEQKRRAESLDTELNSRDEELLTSWSRTEQAEEKVIEARSHAGEIEDRYRRLVEQSPEAVVVHQEGRVVLVNEAALALFGFDASSGLLGKPIRGFLHPESHEAESERLRTLGEQGKAPALTQQLLRSDGNVVFAETIAAPVAYGGEPAVQVIFRDISDRQRLEEQFLKAARLETLAVLAGGIAHDFNNLLTAVLANLSLAQLDENVTGRIGRRIEEAKKAAIRARDLTEELLKLARGGETPNRPLSVPHVLEDAARFALRGSNVDLKLSLPPETRAVEGDERQLRQLVHNLVLNASQAMPRGGPLFVTCRNFQKSAPGDSVLITVEDKGTGMTEEQQKRAFEPYFSTKREGGGLGLTTARAIVESHGGTIEIDSEFAAGTVVRVHLPSTEATAETPSDKVTEALRPRVLLMDDEEMLREVAGEILSAIGFEVDYARDGREAVVKHRAARESGRGYVGCIMDLTVPGGVGGKEAIRELREEDPDLRAIVVSGYTDDPVMQDFGRFGFVGAVPKPYSYEDLAEAATEAFGECQPA